MPSKQYRQRLYEHYITHQFQQSHEPARFLEEAKQYNRYFAKNYLPHLPPQKNATILDAGCGMGHFLYFLQQQSYTQIQGIDLSAEQVAFCHAHQLPASQHTIHDYLQQRPQHFDCIVFNDVIEHLDKDEVLSTLDLMHRALQPNGVLIVKTLNMANPITGLAGRDSDFTHELGFTELSLRTVLSATHFQHIHLFSPDIYVLPNPLLNAAARSVSSLLDRCFFLLSALYGRTSLNIFGKNLIAIAKKA